MIGLAVIREEGHFGLVARMGGRPDSMVREVPQGGVKHGLVGTFAGIIVIGCPDKGRACLAGVEARAQLAFGRREMDRHETRTFIILAADTGIVMRRELAVL